MSKTNKLPETALEARNQLSDVADVLKRVRTLGRSSTAKLTLPEGADAKLLEAQEALFAALRLIEAVL